MILDIMNVAKLVDVNQLIPVTSPLFFNKNKEPDPNGIFSYEIFGLPGSKERKLKFSYIELDGPYLHPNIYNTLSRVNRKIIEIIEGNDYYIINAKTKDIEKVTGNEEVPGMGCGISFLYDNWENIVFKATKSLARGERLEFLKMLKKDDVFMTKQIVIPPFLRDIEAGSMRVSELNGFYRKLITTTTVIKNLGTSTFSYNITRGIIQHTINMIYEYFINMIEWKFGFLHQAVMGKNIDYGVRTLISAPSFNANSWKDMTGDFEHAAVPLTQCIGLFTIAVQHFIITWIDSIVVGRTSILIYNPNSNECVKQELDKSWRDEYSTDMLLKKMALYILSPETRFYPVTIKCTDGIFRPIMFCTEENDIVFDGGVLNNETFKNCRYFTWTDLFYIAAFDSVKDKHVYITRYPITGMHSHYIAKARIQSTINTTQMMIQGELYNKYPVVDLSVKPESIERLFIDSLEIFTPFIGPMGGDHDGDQVNIRSLYTYEANEYCDKYIYSLANALNIGGKSDRNPGDSGDHTMYNLLRDPDD